MSKLNITVGCQDNCHEDCNTPCCKKPIKTSHKKFNVMLILTTILLIIVQININYLLLINKIIETKKEFWLINIPFVGLIGLLTHLIKNLILYKYPVKSLFVESYKELK